MNPIEPGQDTEPFRMAEFPKPLETIASSTSSNQDGFAPPQRRRERFPECDDLRQEILEISGWRGAQDTKSFLPNDKLEELVTRERVLSVLRETTMAPENHEGLATWLVESGKRLFLTLVCASSLNAGIPLLESLFRDGHCGDSALPFDSEKMRFIKGWTRQNDAACEIHQWIFLAPVFEASSRFGCFEQILYSKQRLPLTNFTKSVRAGVFYGDLHPAHIDKQYISQSDMSNPGPKLIPVCVERVVPNSGRRGSRGIKREGFRAEHVLGFPPDHKPIAAYKQNKNYYVIFQQLDGGESRETRDRERFVEKVPTKPVLRWQRGKGFVIRREKIRILSEEEEFLDKIKAGKWEGDAGLHAAYLSRRRPDSTVMSDLRELGIAAREKKRREREEKEGSEIHNHV